MNRFIQELRDKGIMDRMVKSCVVANAATETEDIPLEAVVMMLNRELVDDPELREHFVDVFSDIGYHCVHTVVCDNVKNYTMNPDDRKVAGKLDNLFSALEEVINTITRSEDDLK